MKPTIEGTLFGSISVGGREFSHDVVIKPDGSVGKRKKKLSKALYGTSHIISLAEAKDVYRSSDRPEQLIIGSGQEGMVHLSPEAARYLTAKGCRVVLAPTAEAIETWNRAKCNAAGLVHVTC